MVGCATRSAVAAAPAANKSAALHAAPKAAAARPAEPQVAATAADMDPPPDIFDAQALDLEFWLKPRTLDVVRPDSKERAKVLYWKDGEVIDSAYQELCHLLRDVSARETVPIDPKLFETLWGTQAFVARYGIDSPVQILSGYRTPAHNRNLIESGVPAARKSLHMEGRAADIRLANLNEEVLGGLIRSFRQGGVGFYYRAGPRGGWIHTDTGLKRAWKG
ncbi:MAG TPA: DUF882 domain-containing protein [Janthinobacterium sp.]|nr:DUF882 domain-containing protein [Janthinobacterium sp.]